VRFARTLELPANRGRILDRNGLLLATSVPVPSIWAIPEDVEATRRKLASWPAAGDAAAELNKKLGRRGQELRLAQAPGRRAHGAPDRMRWASRASTSARNTAPVPRGRNRRARGRLHQRRGPGQEGMELAFNKDLAGRAGSRRVIKDRLGRIVEDVGEQVPPVDGKDLQLSIDSKVQFFAYQKLRDAVIANKAKAGSVVVLDVPHRRSAGAGQLPELLPDKRQNLTGAQLRNRA
jgi:cell division protein FtsI (penicillin-binding protein 3)